ncbi:hypothetical protein KR032_009754 [Drosophila birchii]|nr:hypothetical protein KR032_009754 [Drosophila birchii]
MFRKQSSLLVLCLFCLAAATLATKVPKLHFSIKPNAHIVELQSESRELAATHADVSSACFYVYKPILDSVATEYETNYGACVSAYGKSSDEIKSKYEPVRSDIMVTTSLACNACCKVWLPDDDVTDLSSLIDRVQCAADVSAENSKILYSVSANATENSVKIAEEYRIVETQHDICVNDAERTYVQDTTTTYEQLNACLKGKEPVPTSQAPYTTTTTPDAPRDDSPDDVPSRNYIF